MPRTGSWLAGIVLALSLPAALSLAANAAAEEPRRVDPWIEGHLGEFVALYKQLHSHPELSLQEVQTAKRLGEELRKAGAEVTTGVGRVGIVGVLKNGRGPTVLVRSDMDALPVTETTGLPYASGVQTLDRDGRKTGVMHACGHDLHMANLVGTARWLADHRDAWSGTVILIGQPAEESGGGARRMLADGLYRRFPRPNYALALHVSPDIEAGKLGICAGPTMAGTTEVDITVHGKGGHGAMPNKTVDPVVLASSLVLDLQTIVSREIDPVDPAVITVGSIHGGTASNIIPEEVRLEMTLRWFKPEVRDILIEGIERRAYALAQGHGAPPPRIDLGGGVPPLINTPELVEKVEPALAEALGADNLEEIDPMLIAEDFALYGQDGVPTFMFRLGTIAPARLAKAGHVPMPSLHSPSYYPDAEPSLRTGIRAMSAAVVRLLPPV